MTDVCRQCGRPVTGSTMKCPHCGTGFPIGYGTFYGFLSVGFAGMGLYSLCTTNPAQGIGFLLMAGVSYLALRRENNQRKERKKNDSGAQT